MDIVPGPRSAISPPPPTTTTTTTAPKYEQLEAISSLQKLVEYELGIADNNDHSKETKMNSFHNKKSKMNNDRDKSSTVLALLLSDQSQAVEGHQTTVLEHMGPVGCHPSKYPYKNP